MAHETGAAAAPEGEAAASKKGGGKLVLGVVLIVGLALGGGVGVFVAAPGVAGMIASAGSGHESDGEGSGDHGGGGRSNRSGASSNALFTVENLVVNPAGTKGTRFLMATVVFELDGADVVEELRRREAQVRDALLTLLGAKTVEDLVDVEARDTLRDELREVVKVLIPRGRVGSVYFSQFVIQ